MVMNATNAAPSNVQRAIATASLVSASVRLGYLDHHVISLVHKTHGARTVWKRASAKKPTLQAVTLRYEINAV